MQNKKQIKQVVIVGGGPVGNFSAVMISMLGVACIVYEKRESYSREINLKIEKDFFKNVGKIMNRISRRNEQFFENLDRSINQKNGKILLKTLENNLKQEALRMGSKYNIGKEIKTFQQIEKLHNSCLILDCTGRNSPLRINQFGNDQQNMRIYNLHHALHINFKAEVTKNFNFQLLYPVIKNSQNLKLGEVIVSKKKDAEQKYAHVTVPLFISDELSDLIDKKYPNINRVPLKPFSIKNAQSNIQQEVEEVIYSLFCALSMENWKIDWKSVVLKKINITCGYALNRSRDRYICLGDSAAHFAYFKSLNFGLKHAFQFVKILSTYSHLKSKLQKFDQKNIINRFWKLNPVLWPTKARQSSSPSNYFITTNQVGILAPYTFNIFNNNSTRISILPQIKQQKIEQIFDDYQKQQGEKTWQHYVDKFEKIRKFDIDMQIMSNKNKKTGSEMIAYFIWLNGLSPIKLSETISLVANGYYLDKKDFDYFSKTMGSLKKSTQNWINFIQNLQNKVEVTLKQKKGKLSKQFEQFLQKLSKFCINQSSKQLQFCSLVLNFEWDHKSNKNKEVTLLFQALQIIATIISQQNLKQQQNIMKQTNPEQISLN